MQINIYQIDALAGKVVAIATPDYSTFFAALTQKSENYEIECSDQGQKMYHLPDRQLVSEASLLASSCYSVEWAKNEAAASLVSDEGDVYVWRTDGTAPFVVGSAMPSSGAAWSPNSSQLVVTSLTTEGGSGTFNIAYLDGKPMQITGATIEAGNGWDPTNVLWLTNTIVQNMRQCGDGGACLSYSYYDANTGKYLIGYIVDAHLGEGQFALLSPNEQWLALDTYLNEDVWEQRYSYENRVMVLYDLKNHKKHVWANGDDSYAFSGWASDSREFYFVRYPFEGQKPGTLLGLIALDPFTLKTKVVIPNVLLASESPDHNSIFVIPAATIRTWQAIQLQAAVYTPAGKRITPLQDVANHLDFENLGSVLIPSEWSHKSNQVVFADSSGNLWLFNSEGKSTRLASSLPTEEWPEETAFKWSPDDRRLFVYRAHRAWVVTIN